MRMVLKENLQNIAKQLADIVAHDQRERNEYLKNYLEPMGYEAGVQKWIKDKNRKADDVFDDKKHEATIKKLVGLLIKQQKTLDETLLDDAFILVQHMDRDRSFQKQFLHFLAKFHPNTGPFKYLSDRISCAETGTQKYGTQNGCGA